MHRFVVDMHITGMCNMQCAFCCGTPLLQGGPGIDEYKHVIDMLIEVGVTTLVYSGGEPLIKPRIEEYLKYAFSAGLELYLSTNGMLLERKYPLISEFLTSLGFSIDGSTPEATAKMTRDPRCLKSIITFLRMLKDNPPKHRLRAGTVIGRPNMTDIENIGRLLFEDQTLYAPDVWRLYEFSPLNRGQINHEQFEISNQDFVNICRTMKLRFPAVNISPLSNEDSNNAYFFIAPDLTMQVLSNENYLTIADLNVVSSKDLAKVIARYRSVVDRGEMNRVWLSTHSNLVA